MLATPAVRHWAKTHDIDLGEIQGSGKDGRVLKDDIVGLDAKSLSSSQ